MGTIKSIVLRSITGFFGRVDNKIIRPLLGWLVAVLSKPIHRGKTPGEFEEDWKLKAMADFDLWLREIPDEPPAAEQASLESCDLYTLLSEFAGLRQEIRFQNREQAKSVKATEDLASGMLEAAALFKSKSEALSELEEKIRLACEKKTAAAFFESRDSLVRGQAATRKVMKEKTFLRPLPKGTDGILEGYEIALRRMDRALVSLDIHPVETVGKPFDPATMKAVDIKAVLGIESGTVAEEISGGFYRNNEILKFAHVIVAE